MKPRVVVDWDGTCVENDFPDFGDWLPGAVDALRELDSLGLEVVIFSCRVAPMEFGAEMFWREPEAVKAEVDGIHRMLDAEGLGHLEVWTRPYKPPAIAYVDDRAVPYRGNWREAVLDVEDLLIGVRR